MVQRRTNFAAWTLEALAMWRPMMTRKTQLFVVAVDTLA